MSDDETPFEMMKRVRDKKLAQGDSLPSQEVEFYNNWVNELVRDRTVTEAEGRELYLPHWMLALHLLPLGDARALERKADEAEH
jgi:hypothetical protein